MSFTFAHQRTVQGGGVPLPSGAVILPASAPCGGTGQPAATYPYTFNISSDNALFYDISIDGGAFSPSTPVPGNPPVTGNFNWSLTINIPTKTTSMQSDTLIPIILRLRPVADVAAVTYTINFNATLARCARPVGLTTTSCTYNGCDTSSCSISWTSTAANVASITYQGAATSPNNTVTVINDPGNKTISAQSISGVAADASTQISTVNRFYQTECVTDSSCVRSDCRGAPTGCGGNWVTDCRGMCVDPGSAWGLCDCPSPGSCVAPGTCQSRDCAGTCGGSFVPCDCPSPGSCVASCQTRDCNGVCGGSAVLDCAGTCGGTATDCGCGCNQPCVSCPGGTVACGGAPCPAAPPSCSNGGFVYFTCCGCMVPMGGACDNFGFIAQCSGDPSQNCMICVNGTACSPASSFSTTGGCLSLWDTCANCDGGNPGGAQELSIVCDNGSSSISNSC